MYSKWCNLELRVLVFVINNVLHNASVSFMIFQAGYFCLLSLLTYSADRQVRGVT